MSNDSLFAVMLGAALALFFGFVLLSGGYRFFLILLAHPDHFSKDLYVEAVALGFKITPNAQRCVSRRSRPNVRH